MILCEIDFNAILVEPMKNQTLGKMSKSYKKLMKWLNAANIFPKKTHLRQQGFQRLPSTHHTSRNKVWESTSTHAPSKCCQKKQYIHSKTWPVSIEDSQCISGTVYCHKQKWHSTCYEQQISYCVSPFMSTYMDSMTTIECHYHHWVAMPWHTTNQTQEYCGSQKWRILCCTSPEHYWCFKILMKDTQSIWISDAINFHHKHITTPNLMLEDTVTAAAAYLAMVQQTTMVVQLSETAQQALKQLSHIFTTAVKSRYHTLEYGNLALRGIRNLSAVPNRDSKAPQDYFLNKQLKETEHQKQWRLTMTSS